MGPVRRFLRSVSDWCRRRVQRALRRNRRLQALDLLQTVPAAPVATDADRADWSVRDVLVGSFKSREQFQDNFSRNYYYMPAGLLEGEVSDVRYVALYQSQRFFRDQSGIRYYGRVTSAKQVLRVDVDFPGSPDLAEELYYVFTVDAWQILPRTISIRDEGVYAPRCTGFFLLQSCHRSYELFQVRSATDFHLMTAIDRALEDLPSTRHRKAPIYPIPGHGYIAAVGKHLLLTDTNGNVRARLPVKSFVQNPRSSYLRFKMHLGK